MFFTKSKEWHLSDEKTPSALKMVDKNGKLLTIKSTEDELSNESQQILGRAYDFEKLRNEKELIVPWIIEQNDCDIPCIRVVDRKIELCLTEYKDNSYELSKLLDIQIVPLYLQNEFAFDLIFAGWGYSTGWQENKIFLCQISSIKNKS